MKEIVKLKVQMKKNGQPTYLNEDKDSLLIASDYIEDGRGLPFDFHGVE